MLHFIRKHPWMTILLFILLIILAAAVFAGAIFLTAKFHPAIGSLPSGARLERIRASVNYRDGAFVNRESTASLINVRRHSPKSPERYPDEPVKAVKTDLASMPDESIVWFGHSSYLIATGGKKILVDPALELGFPVSFFLKPFKGSNIWRAKDLPEIDWLVITHDHWDHLDYRTLKRLQNRIGQIVCPLGVGAHLERWGFAPEIIHELDWDEELDTGDKLKFTCLTARHFSGRLFNRNQSLWASFMIEAGSVIYVGGDSGYGSHFAEIGRRFPKINIAMMENGQYNTAWSKIHTLPEQLPNAIREIGAMTAVPIHNSKFCISRHAWYDPIVNIQTAIAEDPALRVTIPTIGEIIAIPK